ncbi:MAG: TraB/GumN family protein [Halobacteria archaeon]|nr:TraB/GumN family protein [Halobacteria archaeon]
MENDGEIVLVGTAHVSQKSVDEVRKTIEEENPDVVAVELDQRRYNAIKQKKPDDLNPRDLLRGSAVFEILVYWLLSYIQNKLGEKFGVEPGADMVAAIESAEDREIPVALVDRDIRVTLQRFWAKMSLFEKFKFIGALIAGLVGYGRGSTEDIHIDDITDADVVQIMMEEFREFSPRGAEALIDERDAYIASKLVSLRSSGKKVVAVVGAGHKEGIERYLADPSSIPPIEEISKNKKRRFSIFRAIGYAMSGFVILMFVLLFMAGASNELLLRLFLYWFLINGILAFVGALIAGGRLTSAITGGLVAWMTSLNPALAPGWFAGYVELRYLNVSLSDIDKINQILGDTEATTRQLVSRMYEVPMFRLLMVVALTNLGSIIGTGLFVFVILPIVDADVNMTELLSRELQESWQRLVDAVL